MFCVLNLIALLVGWFVLLVALAVHVIPWLASSSIPYIVALVCTVLSLAVSFFAFFVWWPQYKYRINLSRGRYALLVGFKGLWRWVGMVVFFLLARIAVRLYLKKGYSIEDIANLTGMHSFEVYHLAYQATMREYPFSVLVSHEDFY